MKFGRDALQVITRRFNRIFHLTTWRHTFKMGRRPWLSFHAEKFYHLVRAHAAYAQWLNPLPPPRTKSAL